MDDNLAYIFSFKRVSDFFKNMNRNGCFDLLEMDGINMNYRLVLVSSCPDNVMDCLDVDGKLNNRVVHVPIDDDGLCSLQYNEGINNDFTISVAQSQINVDVGDGDVLLKGAFIVDDNTGYVLAYSILNTQIPVSNDTTFPVNGVLWTIRQEIQ